MTRTKHLNPKRFGYSSGLVTNVSAITANRCHTISPWAVELRYLKPKIFKNEMYCQLAGLVLAQAPLI